MKIIHKQLHFHEVKTDDAARTVEGWASTFGNKDAGDDIILPGAFAASLTQRKPKMLWQHNTDQVIGVWDTAQETEKGLYVKGRILPTALGNDAYELAKAGAIDSMSIGYSTIDASMDYESGVRTLKTLDLWEVSLVTFPMNDKATITSVKAIADDIDSAYELLDQASGICDAYASGEMQPTPETLATVSQLTRQAMSLICEPDDQDSKSRPTERAIEKRLRDAGLSRVDAKKLIAGGYKAIAPQRDADEQALNHLFSLLNQFTV
jgi:uncharacterized protein